jgi:hypothetical protein
MRRSISVVVVALALCASAVTVDAQGRGRALGRQSGPPPQGPTSRGYQEPAYARGYSDGYRHAQDDRDNRRAYDPVRLSDYREADQGFYRSYGSKDAYKNNYRAGFRAGYDAGYRDGSALRR